jgi:pyruvate kinase
MIPNRQPRKALKQWDQRHLRKLIDDLAAIRNEMILLQQGCLDRLDKLHPDWRQSGTNMLHYLALRHRDIRPLQEKLAGLGLSSLGRTESHVLASLSALLMVLRALDRQPVTHETDEAVSFVAGRQLLEQHTERLLGPRPGQRATRVMVTMPSEAATDYLLVRDLVAHGMDCMRINCAHDDEQAWGQMIDNLRRAKRELGKKCRVLMDLGGPKLRTGPIESGPAVMKWRPLRDRLGAVLEPARIWFRPDDSDEVPDGPACGILPMPREWLSSLNVGDAVAFNDARNAARTIRIVDAAGDCRWGESLNTVYVTPGLTMHRITSAKKKGKESTKQMAVVSSFPADSGAIHLRKGDTLILTRSMEPGRAGVLDDHGRILNHPCIGCSLPEVFDCVKAGERIFFDDGKIGGVIRAAYKDRLRVEIVSSRPQGDKLGPEKGINLPDSHLRMSALTDKDRSDLGFIVRYAHMVGMSFVQEVADVADLLHELVETGGAHLGIVLKIETRRGFEMLPDLILAAMASPSAGVMIARGDLAVECGYERLAEIQEEILWLCEAAHIPVIWATQVLESLAKAGIPSRAEITDAAMSSRAECVMLNKGPHVVEAVRVLDNILQRMAEHQSKKSPLLRQLRWWEQAQRK